MPAPTNPPVLTTTRDPVRRVFHGLLALGGWLLLVYTWWTVFRPGLDQGALWIFAGIAVTFGVIVLANQLWVWHNLTIFRTRPRRVHVRAVEPVIARDALGRLLDVEWSAMRGAGRIVIEIPADDRKVYAISSVHERLPGAPGGGSATVTPPHGDSASLAPPTGGSAPVAPLQGDTASGDPADPRSLDPSDPGGPSPAPPEREDPA